MRFTRPRSEIEVGLPGAALPALRRPAHALPTPVSKARDAITLAWIPRLTAATGALRRPSVPHPTNPTVETSPMSPTVEPSVELADGAETPQPAQVDRPAAAAAMAALAAGQGESSVPVQRRRPNHRAPSGRRAAARANKSAGSAEATVPVEGTGPEGTGPVEVLPDERVSRFEPITPPQLIAPVIQPVEELPTPLATPALSTAPPLGAGPPMPAPTYPTPKPLADLVQFAPFADLPETTTPPAAPTRPPAPPVEAPPAAPEPPAPAARAPRSKSPARRRAAEPNAWLQRLALAGLGLVVLVLGAVLVAVAFHANGGPQNGIRPPTSVPSATTSPSPTPTPPPTSGQSDAADWITANLAKESRITAEPAVVPLLTDAGFSSVRSTTDYADRGVGEYLVASNAARTASGTDPTLAAALNGSVALARFGDGDDPTDVRTVLNRSAGAIDAQRSADQSQRRSVGAELAANPQVITSATVHSQLTDGILDIRAATVLDQLAAQNPVNLLSIDPVTAETRAGMPARQITISTAQTSSLIAAVRALPAALQPTQFIANATGGQLVWPVEFAPQV
ncbi:hypothetical protein SAMN05892883_0334 [Jatrophihabitans sp. GAS493]|nr:hypothetical protein SAMN05892883_0334 [Jatrophihabitans sp. GAS493]